MIEWTDLINYAHGFEDWTQKMSIIYYITKS